MAPKEASPPEERAGLLSDGPPSSPGSPSGRTTGPGGTKSVGYSRDARPGAPPPQVRILAEIVGARNLSPAILDAAKPKRWASVTPVGALVPAAVPADGGGLPVPISSRYFLGHDGTASPYCRVRFGDRVVHRTDEIPKCNNPIWTVNTGSVFVLTASNEELVGDNARALTFELRDKDMILGTSARIGTVRVDAPTLLKNCTEERVEFPMNEDDGDAALDVLSDDEGDDNDGHDRHHTRDSSEGMHLVSLFRTESAADAMKCDECDDGKATLALRFRLATDDDMKLLKSIKLAKLGGIGEQTFCSDVIGRNHRINLRTDPSGLITEKEETEVGYKGIVDALSNALRGTKIGKDGKVRHRVKPGPDPARPEETKYLTDEELTTEAFAPSHNWIEAGSGSLGKVFVEIISCEGLPNLDSGETLGNKTDSFVTVVHEDAILQTEVIDDCLSPLWMPWTQRAFAFNRNHPLSPLCLAVFDYDIGPMNSHDGIGRVSINLSNLTPDVVHTLKYNLYPSSVITARESQGTITVRVRVDSVKCKDLLMAGITSPPTMHINVNKPKSLGVARYTCYGKYDEEKYNMTLLRSYINEIFDYKRSVSYSIGDSLRSLLFWRGQVQVGIFNLPLHSAAAYLISIHVVERPHLIPSLTFLGIAWLMVANMTVRAQHPSPWRRCTSFRRYLSILQTGRPPASVGSIEAGENAAEAAAYDDAWTRRVEADQEAAARRWELQKELDEIGNDGIETKTESLQLDPLARLLPYQRMIAGVCYNFRLIRMAVTWEESLLSFWITLGSLGMAVVLFILPSAWLLHWLCKIVVWVFLGPWMRLVDMMLVGNVDFKCERDRMEHQENTVKELLKHFKHMSRQARVRGEEALKLKAMRILRFGRYIVRVPSANVVRHYDYPLPGSYAQWASQPLPAGWDRRAVIPGQLLHGAMLPRSRSVYLRQKQTMLEDGGRLAALRWAALGEPEEDESEGGEEVPVSTDLSESDRGQDKGGTTPLANEGFEVEMSDDTSVVRTASLRARKICALERYVAPIDEDECFLTPDSPRSIDNSLGGSEKGLRHDQPDPPKPYLPVPSQIDGGPVVMDEMSALGMEDCSKPAEVIDTTIQQVISQSFTMHTVIEQEEEQLEDQGVEVVNLEPLAEWTEADDDTNNQNNLSCISPLYQSSEHPHVVFFRR